MLIEASKVIKPSKLYKYPFIGKVVDNKDPKKLGRVKVFIEGLLEGDTKDLPWVMMENGTGFGGTGQDSAFIVPLVGASLNIHFPYDDIYFPVYRGFYQSSITHQSAFDDNYPHKFGFQAGEHKFVIDREKSTVDVELGNGVKVSISTAGEIEVTGAKITFKAPEIIHNQKLSGITTANSHMNVIDLVTGIACIPSITTFGDV